MSNTTETTTTLAEPADVGLIERLRHPGRPTAVWLATLLSAPVLAAIVGMGFVVLAEALEKPKSTYYFSENRAGTFTNVGIILLCSLAARLVTSRSPRSSPERKFWAFNAWAFFFLALDDLFSIHENVDRGVHWLLGWDPLDHYTSRLDDVIVLAYGVVVLVVWYRNRATVLARPWMIYAMAAGAAQFGLMVAMDLFDLGEHLGEKAGEEIVKMTASATIAAALFEPLLNRRHGAPRPRP